MFRYIPFFHFIYFKLNYWSSEATINIFSTKLIHRIPRMGAMFLAWIHRARQIRDKALRKTMTPNYEMGCRRIVVSSDFYPAVAQKNVHVHTQAISGVKGNTLMLADGSVQEVDALVLATGFNVHDIILPKFLIGQNGVDVREKWGNNQSTYYGVTCSDAPNLYFKLGPKTGIVS